MHLHEDKELFREVIISTADDLNLVVPIVEKDYYVTMILKKLSKERPEAVFKGGTSLSKCYHVIERFSEDVDIAFSNTLTQGQRKYLYCVITTYREKLRDIRDTFMISICFCQK